MCSSTDHLVLLDWDDTVMPTSFLLDRIDVELDASTQRLLSWKLKDGVDAESMRRALWSSGSAALRMLSALYCSESVSVRRLSMVMVTNGVSEWLCSSLIIAGTLCPIYRQIEQLLHVQSAQIIYARNHCLNPNYWKLACFDQILCRELDRKRCRRLNVITVGDQWTDHCSVELTATFRRRHSALSHHQIKLLHRADARYLAVELHYVADVVADAHSALFRFADNQHDGVLIEFEGYNHSEGRRDGQSDSESLDTPKSDPVYML